MQRKELEEFIRNEYKTFGNFWNTCDTINGQKVESILQKRSSEDDHDSYEVVFKLGDQLFRQWGSYNSENGVEFYDVELEEVEESTETRVIYKKKDNQNDPN